MVESNPIEDIGNTESDFYKVEISDELNSIPVREPKFQIDALKYKGFKTKIAKVRQFEVIDHFVGPKNSKGMPSFVENSTVKKRIVEVETYPLPELDVNGNPIIGKIAQVSDKVSGGTRPLIVTARFNLKKDINPQTNVVEWSISKAPGANLWAFMRKQGAKVLTDLKDTIVLLDAAPDSDESSDRFWLRIGI